MDLVILINRSRSMENFKRHWIELQQMLFKNGYHWGGSGHELIEVDPLYHFIITEENKYIFGSPCLSVIVEFGKNGNNKDFEYYNSDDYIDGKEGYVLNIKRKD